MSPLVNQGLELAIIGMGTVFVFLTMLVLATMAMSRLVLPTVKDSATSVDAHSDNRKLAAISAAIHQHRNRQS
jgi:oxaloacetate decarboxylase gamma subunit